ncbi:MAG: YggS family pyridoxal phosphate-dependent enzyme, partial [Bacteroidales bacterium]|nr:YggS family pyridoxal phosphate-dependent enzyme [Candidatus Cryptobacteroides fimicaballi]
MIGENLRHILNELPSDVKLVAVSKFHPAESVETAYREGQRIFAESRPQELEAKAKSLSALEGLEWQFIGHLQTNKLKMVLPYVSLVQSVDSEHLLAAIDDWAGKNSRVVNVLLELHVAAEEQKQGFCEEEVLDIMFRYSDTRGGRGKLSNIRICGLMAMATNTDDESVIEADFARVQDFFLYLKDVFPELDEFRELSIGMSGDWPVAVRYGATMVRIGT